MASTNGSATAATLKQEIRSQLTNCISQYFSGTIGRETDIVNVCMGLIQEESSFNINAQGKQLSIYTSSLAKDYFNSAPVQNIATSGTSQQKALVYQGLQAWGLMQSMGLNSIHGASKSAGKTAIEAARPDLASTLVFPAGTDLSQKFNGQATITNQLLAGLVLLESKYKYVTQKGNSFQYGKNSEIFNSRLAAAIGAYLGTGSDTQTGITVPQYVANIMYGSKYKLANSTSSSGVITNSPTNTPVITTASGDNQVPPGC